LLVDLSTGAVETDHVVVAVGVEPDSQLAGASNIQVRKPANPCCIQAS